MGLSNVEVLLIDSAFADISQFVTHVQAEFTGTEEVSNAILLLSCKQGRFLTAAPIINHFDRVFLKFTDRDGNVESAVFEVLKIKPMEKQGRGINAEIYLTHQSWYVWQDQFTNNISKASGFEVVKDVCDSYNVDAGSAQPQIANQGLVFDTNPVSPTYLLGNAMSQATYNDYDFGNSEEINYNVILEVIDKLGSPVPAGGEFEFYEVVFKSAFNENTHAGLNTINLSCFPSGYVTGTPITISKTVGNPKVIDTDGNLDAFTGTNIFAWGDPTMGSLPTGYSIYVSQKEFYNAAKFYQNTIPYLKDMRVLYNGSFYRCTNPTTPGINPSNPGFWTLDVFTPTSDYSPWTKNKAQYWINCGSSGKDAGVVNGPAGVVDQNAVIRDDNHRRTWVDVVATNPASIDGTLLIAGQPYRGLRVLCNGVGAGAFAGNDANGQPFKNAVVKYDGTQWLVFIPVSTDMEVFDYYNSGSWTFHLGSWQLGAYNAIGTWTLGLAFDCYHRFSVTSLNNPRFGNRAGVEPSPYGDNSMVYVTFDFTNALINEFPNTIFAGINLAFPFPKTSNSHPWGAVTIGEKYRPETFDRNNMHLTHDNLRGFNQGLSSEDYGPINAIAFYEYFLLTGLGGITIPRGDFKMRIVLYDSSDNVVVADYNHSHNDNTEEIIIPIDNFKIYRARAGPAFIPKIELEVLNIFEWRNINRVCIFCNESYDTDGRFAGIFSGLFSYVGALGGTATLGIDGFRFVKPLLVTSQEQSGGSRPARNLIPEFIHSPLIFNYVQLKNEVKSMLNIKQFKRIEYQVRTFMKCDIKFGNYFYYTNPNLISTTTDGKLNTEKLVAKKVIYDVMKGLGEGGFHRLVIGVKRFVAT